MTTSSQTSYSSCEFYILNMTGQELQILISAEVNKFKEKTKADLVTHYITFLNDGYRKNTAMSVVTNAPVSSFYVSAPEEALASAIVWVKTNNPHLKFAEAHLAGYMNDDAIRNNQTAQLNFQPK